jgi:RNA polymerase sigma-70 factor (ECF subfamily)
LLDLYEHAVPQVYGYLQSRCATTVVAEDLTASTIVAAAEAVNRRDVDSVTVSWLIGIARRQLVDQCRRTARQAASAPIDRSRGASCWEEPLDVRRARAALQRMGGENQAVLTLRYVDGLPVPEVAAVLGRTVAVTEALLTHANDALRAAYEQPVEEGRADA